MLSLQVKMEAILGSSFSIVLRAIMYSLSDSMGTSAQ